MTFVLFSLYKVYRSIVEEVTVSDSDREELCMSTAT